MKKIHMLDCTLRDGGYCNEWQFGYDNIRQIIEGLIEANVEIIECGFLTNKVTSNQDTTKYRTIEEIACTIPRDRDGKLFVAMMNYGEYSIEEIPEYDGSSIDGIRLAFHKRDLNEALSICRQIKSKGYLIFVQAMVSLSYSDNEFLSLITEINNIEPYAFYIVDSFGMMKEKDLIRLYSMVEHNLNERIWIGFHCHNNMQLAYSNAQCLVTMHSNRSIIIDSSIMGMGRGAGNLNTELFVDYLNENAGKTYKIKPLLAIMDKILTHFYEKKYWGYSLPNYISASHNAHPNYAGYLDAKKTLTFEDMNEIFDMMDEEKKISFDKKYIEELYTRFQEKDIVQEAHLSDLRERIAGQNVMVIAPGQSSISERDKIIACAKNENLIIISINYDFDEKLTDFLFVSNLRRYRDLPINKRKKCIVTSNIPSLDVYFQARYKDLINSYDAVKDNAGLMLVELLIQLGVRKIYIAGMDGYSVNAEENYAYEEMSIHTEKELVEKKNIGIMAVLKEYAKEVEIIFVTSPRHIAIT